MKIIGYHGDWNLESLAKIVMYASRHCRYLVLIVAKHRDTEAMNLLHPLLPHLVAQQSVNAWPGTIKLAGETGNVLKFEIGEGTLEVVLYKVLPAMLLADPPVEDISLLRADGRPYFVSITHERDAYFKLCPSEYDKLAPVVGIKNLTVQGDDELPEERY